MKVLLARGVDIPSEMALAGFDNSNLGALAEVPLTSVEVDFRRMGFDAAETLLHRMSSGEFKPFRQTVLPVKLIERSSSVPGSSKGWGWGKALNCAIAR
jgi:DNA-binding LacI/PurR family transcriptional regulator